MSRVITGEEPHMNRCRRHWIGLLLIFILGLKEGNIALWKAGNDQPVRIFPYRCETLPPSVQQSLTDGIAFESADEAREAAENYLS